MKILMVCLGNYCRSPLAEGILQNKSILATLHWKVDSAGTAGYHIGEQPHILSQKVAKLYGIDLSNQRCRQFIKEDIREFDKIFVMDNANYQEVKRISGEAWDEEKVSLLLNSLYPGENREVPDPWNGSEMDYQLVFEMLDKASDKIIEMYRFHS